MVLVEVGVGDFYWVGFEGELDEAEEGEVGFAVVFVVADLVVEMGEGF